MPREPHSQRLLDLARARGILRPRDLDKDSIPRVTLTRLVRQGALERVARGLYRHPDQGPTEHEGLVTVAAVAPQAVFCLLTALQFHGLTTQLPRQVWITLPQGSHPPRVAYPPLRTIQATGATYSEGIEVIKHQGVSLRVYNPAKTVADCFKHRSKVGLDVAIEALRDVRAQRKASADELWHFAKIDRVWNIMRPYLEAIE